MEEYKQDLLFWLSIMRDHAIFQFNAFSSTEEKYIQNSLYFKNFFEYILNEVEKSENYYVIDPRLMQGLLCFINYKTLILNELLTCRLKMNLPPSLINHQINEANEFKDMLYQCLYGRANQSKSLMEWIKIWLTDSLGHAAGLISFLDLSEAMLADEIEKFKISFNQLLTKASELEMMTNKTKQHYNSVNNLAEETIKLMKEFIFYLEKVKKLLEECKIMGIGTLSPLIPDHFIREHNYFISKIKLYMMESC